MTKPFSLQPLIDLAQHRNESATRRLGQLNKLQQDAQMKLATLQQYRSDYQTRLQESTRSGMNPDEIRNFREFIHKIDDAIAQQLQVVEQSKASTQAGRGEFDSTRRKVKSFGMLQQRHIDAQNKVAEKAEQKALDEHTGRFAARKMLKSEEPNT